MFSVALLTVFCIDCNALSLLFHVYIWSLRSQTWVRTAILNSLSWGVGVNFHTVVDYPEAQSNVMCPKLTPQLVLARSHNVLKLIESTLLHTQVLC